MKNKNGSNPANPLSGDAYTDYSHYDGTNKTSCNPECQGLTKREHLAGIAMQGIISSEHIVDFMVDGKSSSTSANGYEAIAVEACRYADALLKELDE